VILVVVSVLPFFIWILLWKKLSFLNQEWAIKRFGSTYASIKNDQRSALLYNVFYMLRRLLIALVAIYAKNYSFL